MNLENGECLWNTHEKRGGNTLGVLSTARWMGYPLPAVPTCPLPPQLEQVQLFRTLTKIGKGDIGDKGDILPATYFVCP